MFRSIVRGRSSVYLEILPQGIRIKNEDYLSCSNATPAMYPLGLMMAGAFRISSGEVLSTLLTLSAAKSIALPTAKLL